MNENCAYLMQYHMNVIRSKPATFLSVYVTYPLSSRGIRKEMMRWLRSLSVSVCLCPCELKEMWTNFDAISWIVSVCTEKNRLHFKQPCPHGKAGCLILCPYVPHMHSSNTFITRLGLYNHDAQVSDLTRKAICGRESLGSSCFVSCSSYAFSDCS